MMYPFLSFLADQSGVVDRSGSYQQLDQRLPETYSEDEYTTSTGTVHYR